MQLATRYHYINGGINFQGILKVVQVRQFDQFIIQIEILKILSTDVAVIEAVRKQCYENSTRVELINKVDTQAISSCMLNYNEVEQYYNVLGQQIATIQNADPQTLYNFTIHNKIKVVLTLHAVKRLYWDLASYYQNYFVLESSYKMLIQITNGDVKAVLTPQKKIVEQAKETNKKLPPPPPPKTPSSPMNNTVGLYDNIISLSASPVVKTALIHQLLNYYKYISSSQCSVEKTSSGIIIKIPNIVEPYTVSTQYFWSMIMSMRSVPTSQVNFYSDKLVSALINAGDKLRPVHIMMIMYLLFLYSLRVVSDTHLHWIDEQLPLVLSDADMQQKTVMYHVNNHSQNTNITLEIQSNSRIGDKNVISSEELAEISARYKYLTNVDEISFIKHVLEESSHRTRKVPSDFTISSKKVLDIDLLRDVNVCSTGRDTSIFGRIDTNVYDIQLLKYDFNNSNTHLTSVYSYFSEYMNNPSIVMSIKDQTIPEQVIKLFEVLKEVITVQYFDVNDVDTLSYYRILCEKIPTMKFFTHDIVLYIIFQIVIPYYYHMYKVRKFSDSLLY